MECFQIVNNLQEIHFVFLLGFISLNKLITLQLQPGCACTISNALQKENSKNSTPVIYPLPFVIVPNQVIFSLFFYSSVFLFTF